MANPVLKEKQGLLAWSLLVLLILVGLLFVVLPVFSYSQTLTEQIDDGYEKLARYRQVAQATPQYMAEYERVQKQGLDKLFYSEGMTSAQVAKELQKQLATIITRNDGVLVRSEVLDQYESKEQVNSVYEQVAVRATLQGDTRLLRTLLHQSYRARPMIFVEQLEVKPSDRKGQDKDQKLKAEVVISTYWRGGSANNEEMD
jgi:ribosomal protein L17